MEFKVVKAMGRNKDHYYIAFHDGEFYIDSDRKIAEIVNLPIEQYIYKLKNKFNATTLDYECLVYFKNKIEAKQAMEWLRSRILIKELKGEGRQ
jgi:hypothetical protein